MLQVDPFQDGSGSHATISKDLKKPQVDQFKESTQRNAPHENAIIDVESVSDKKKKGKFNEKKNKVQNTRQSIRVKKRKKERKTERKKERKRNM